MDDLINRQAAIEAVGDVHPLDYNGQAILHRIQQLPTIDAVPVVRCKDCIHLTCTGWCGREFDWYPVDPDDFCSNGARMDGERREG